MAQVRQTLRVKWQEPIAEAHWQDAQPPADAATLEAAVREALEAESGERELLVIFRRDGTRWRVMAEFGDAVGAAADADPRSTLDLTRLAVEALRRAGVQAEPGFPADPNELNLPVGPTE
ncbi:MAG TPA: hypothetical protein VFO85_03365 [Vicinamibacteria bacterium]|nr:hypothetical protein [Vicinamibacteria bacterium]